MRLARRTARRLRAWRCAADGDATADGVTSGSGPILRLGTTFPMRGRSACGPPNGAFSLGETTTSAIAAANRGHARGREWRNERSPACRPIAGVLRRACIGAPFRREDDALGRQARPRRIGVDEGFEEQQHREHDGRDARRAHQHRAGAGNAGNHQQGLRARCAQRTDQRAALLALGGAEEVRVLLHETADTRERDDPGERKPHTQCVEGVAGAGTARAANAPRRHGAHRCLQRPAAPRARRRSAGGSEAFVQ